MKKLATMRSKANRKLTDNNDEDKKEKTQKRTSKKLNLSLKIIKSV